MPLELKDYNLDIHTKTELLEIIADLYNHIHSIHNELHLLAEWHESNSGDITTTNISLVKLTNRVRKLERKEERT